jgi:GNAT superfamily N-acetyltransferase
VSTLDLAAHASASAPAVAIRRAGERDRAALAQMFARCTVQTRYRRFHGHVNVLPARYLDEALSGSPAHLALVAVISAGSADGAIVALASCRAEAQGAADLGVLVEDGWQRQGIGDALLREIAAHASRTGIGMLTAQVLAEQSWILRLLSAYGSCESVTTQGVLDVTVRLSPKSPRDRPPADYGLPQGWAAAAGCRQPIR